MKIDLLLGLALMMVGVALVIAAVFRAMDHRWTMGLYEMWALPVAGFALILLGRWVML